MFRSLLRFSLSLLVISGLTYLIHDFFISERDNAVFDMISFAYRFNVGATFLFTSGIILISERFKEQIGFIYMLTGMVKLGIFLFLIRNSQEELDRADYLDFFIPYVVCVVVEMIYLIRILNPSNPSNDS